MKSLVTGVKGQLGYDIVKELTKRGYTDILAVDYEDMDITNKEQVESVIKGYNPDVIFHCAAYTAVDKAEENVEACTKVNVEGTRNIAEVAKEIGSKLIYISTDYVFDGTKEGIYEVTDTPNPKSVYGLTKYKGELEALKNDKTYVVRISWVFGINGKNFVKTMIKLSQTNDQIPVVNDQIGSPTYTVDLAKLLVDMAETDKYGLYFATNEGYMNWADFAKLIFEVMGIEMKVNPISTEEYLAGMDKVIAERPMNSRLSKQKLIDNGFKLLPTVKDALERYREELIKADVLVKRK
jgi:dTDP-4-dehydrorhamnose reductase